MFLVSFAIQATSASSNAYLGEYRGPETRDVSKVARRARGGKPPIGHRGERKSLEGGPEVASRVSGEHPGCMRQKDKRCEKQSGRHVLNSLEFSYDHVFATPPGGWRPLCLPARRPRPSRPIASLKTPPHCCEELERNDWGGSLCVGAD